MRRVLSLILMLMVAACGARVAQAGGAEEKRIFHDGLKRFYLIERPDAFITISHEMASLLRGRGAKVPVEVVFPGVDTDYYQPASKEACRDKLDLPHDMPVFACVGRINFAQKQRPVFSTPVFLGLV